MKTTKGAKALVGAQVNNVWTRISNSNTRPFFLRSRERKIIDEERAGLGRHFQPPGVSLFDVLCSYWMGLLVVSHKSATSTLRRRGLFFIFNFLIFFLKSIQILKIWNQFYGSQRNTNNGIAKRGVPIKLQVVGSRRCWDYENTQRKSRNWGFSRGSTAKSSGGESVSLKQRERVCVCTVKMSVIRNRQKVRNLLKFPMNEVP